MLRDPHAMISPPDQSNSASDRCLTWRSLLIGSFLAVSLGAGAPYGSLALRGSYLALDFSNAGALFLFFTLVLLCHTGLKLIHQRLGFQNGELVVIYIMALVASPIPMAHMARLLSIISGVSYYASPENEWASLIHPHVPGWLTLQDNSAIKYFFEGLPEGAAIPWSAWKTPLLAWLSLALALHFATICLVVILRRQWIQHERLAFPLVRLPQAI